MSNAYVEVVNQASTKFVNAVQCDMTIYTDSNSQSIHLGVGQNSNSFLKIGDQSITCSGTTFSVVTGSTAAALSNIRETSCNWPTLSNVGTPVVSRMAPLNTQFIGSIDLGNTYYAFSNTGSSNARYNITHSNIFMMTDFTIESWVYYYGTVSNITFSESIGYLVGNMVPTTTTNYWSFGVNANRKLNFYFNANNAAQAALTTSNVIPLNTWTHIAMSYSNNQKVMRFFINGAVQSNLSSTNALWAVSNALSTGASNSGMTHVGPGAGYLVLGRFFNSNNPCFISDFRFKTGFAATNSNQLSFSVNDLNPATRYTGDYFYPPGVFMGSNTASFTNRPYGNGTYIASVSSFYDATSAPYTLFHPGSGYFAGWTPSTAPYTGTSGAYVGAVTTTISGSSYAGEWAQLQLPQALAVNGYTIISNYWPRAPRSFAFAGSTDGSTWTLLNNQSGHTSATWSNLVPVTFYFANTTAYSHYRLVVTSNNGADSFLSIYGLYLNITSNNLPVPEGTNVLVRVPASQTTAGTSLVISPNGSFGVNTSNPTTMLDVNGDMNISRIYRAQTPYYWAQVTAHGSTAYNNAVLGFNFTPETNVPWAYDNTNHRFYFPVAGAYFIVIRGVLGAGGGGNWGTITIRKNGIHLTQGHWNHDDGWENVSCQAIIQATIGDYVDCWVREGNGVYANNGVGFPGYGSMFIKLIAN